MIPSVTYRYLFWLGTCLLRIIITSRYQDLYLLLQCNNTVRWEGYMEALAVLPPIPVSIIYPFPTYDKKINLNTPSLKYENHLYMKVGQLFNLWNEKQ